MERESLKDSARRAMWAKNRKQMITFKGKQILVPVKSMPDGAGNGMYDYAIIPKKYGGGVVNLGVEVIPEMTKCWKCGKQTNQHNRDTCQHCGAEI